MAAGTTLNSARSQRLQQRGPLTTDH